MGIRADYIELAPAADLAAHVRTVWIHRVGSRPVTQRNLPTGGMELHCPLGGTPRLIGPLTRPNAHVLPARTVVVGARFWPGATACLVGRAAEEIVDLAPTLDELWGPAAEQLGESLATSRDPESALDVLQHRLAARIRSAEPVDALVDEAIRRLMPWRPIEIDELSAQLSISRSQLRRRMTAAVGLGPKTLQRTLRFQGYLALAQAAAGRPAGQRRVADLAAAAGYADHPHLARECVRLTGVTPTELLHGCIDRCGCGHDHAASYLPFLAGRPGRHAA